MSTIVVVRKDNDIVIGADTLCKYGYTKLKAGFTKNPSKIIKIGDNYIAIAGGAATNLALKNYFNGLDELPKLSNEDEIFEMACNLHIALKEKYFLKPEEDEDDNYESTRMECFIANKFGIFGIDTNRFVEEYTKFASYGSGYKFALGAMKVAYEQNYTAEEIARIGLEAAAEYDDGTEGPYDIYRVE